MLTGIGEELSAKISGHRNPAAWTKDPLFNIHHVFYAPSGNIVFEYSSWEDFEAGNHLTSYALPNNVAGLQFVVYDRSLYYFKVGLQEFAHHLYVEFVD